MPVTERLDPKRCARRSHRPPAITVSRYFWSQVEPQGILIAEPKEVGDGWRIQWVSGRPWRGAGPQWGRQNRLALDTDQTCLYYSYMYDPIAIALVHAAHRVEARLEEALAGVGLSIAKFEPLSVLVSQDRPISLSQLAEKLTCVRSNVTQLMDRLEADGLVKRADDPADRRAVRAEVTALGRKRQAAGAKVVHAVLKAVAKELSVVDPLVLKRALDAVQ